jgi:hypothetical protein
LVSHYGATIVAGMRTVEKDPAAGIPAGFALVSRGDKVLELKKAGSTRGGE